MVTAHLSYEIDGIMIYKENFTNEESMALLLSDYCTPEGINFSALMGSFRLKISDAFKDETIFFGDNSGVMCFYYTQDRVSDSLLSLKAEKIPDFDAIAQVLSYECTYDYRTIIKDVFRTNPNMFYVLKKGGIEEKSKNLPGFEETPQNTLEMVIEKYVKATSDKRKISIITGGSDSRSILAHLLNKKTDLELSITGTPDHIDVKIAREISEAVDLPLHVFGESPGSDEKEYLCESFIAGDGVYGVLGRYRLYNKSKNLKSLGFEVEFGGVAGELYKNSFLNQDFPFYFGKPDYKWFRNVKLPASQIPRGILTEKMQKSVSDSENIVSETLFAPKPDRSKNKFQIYNDIGYSILQHKMIILTNSSAGYLIPLLPLMERSLVASIYKSNPYAMEFSRYQRKQVSTFYPEIKKIKTDKGIDCSDSFTSIIDDFVKHYLALIPIYIKIHLKKFHLKKGTPVRVIDGRIDEVFSNGLNSKEYEEAMIVCKKMGILSEGVDIKAIPPVIADRLMTIGMVFQ